MEVAFIDGLVGMVGHGIGVALNGRQKFAINPSASLTVSTPSKGVGRRSRTASDPAKGST